MQKDYAALILPIALWRFTLLGFHATKTTEIARLANVGVGSLFRTFSTKEDLLEATYAYAVRQLVAPLENGVGEAQRGEYVHRLLQRWWTLTAQAAVAAPHAFDMWRLYRGQLRTTDNPEPPLGPFASLPEVVAQALASSRWAAAKSISLPLLGASLAAQWTAAVEVVLWDRACQIDQQLTAQVLAQAYTGWWQGLGLSTSLEVAKLAPAPVPIRPKAPPAPSGWLKLLEVATPHINEALDKAKAKQKGKLNK